MLTVYGSVKVNSVCCFIQGNVSPVDLKVQLPDKNVITVSMPKNSTADDVFRAVMERIPLQKSSARFFYLFETVEDMFGKLPLKLSLVIFCIARETFSLLSIFCPQIVNYCLQNTLTTYTSKTLLRRHPHAFALKSGYFPYLVNLPYLLMIMLQHSSSGKLLKM